MIFGINTTSDNLKLLYVIPRDNFEMSRVVCMPNIHVKVEKNKQKFIFLIFLASFTFFVKVGVSI